MLHDPYTLIVCLDRANHAKGTLYIDDEKSFEYHNGKYIYLSFEFDGTTLTSKYIDSQAKYDTQSWLERVQLIGLDRVPKSATLKVDNQNVALDVLQDGPVTIIRKPAVSMVKEWSITLKY